MRFCRINGIPVIIGAASVRLRPDGEKLAFENKEDGLYFVLPQMRCHALIDIETE